MNETILIVDDELEIAEGISSYLSEKGYSTHCVSRGMEAIEYVKRYSPRLVLLDIRLPDIGGVDLLSEIKRTSASTDTMMITGYGTVELAVQCMKLGARDLIQKPFRMEELESKIKNILVSHRIEKEDWSPRRDLDEKHKLASIIGQSPKTQKILERVELAAKSRVSVLLEGESGTGKEIVARAIHFNGLRNAGPFVAVNCGAIPDTLLESELYGYERGAFTGAVSRKIGKFEQAQGGTIFLDEIGDLSHSLQVKLLRVLQEREIERIGGNQPIAINARFISATNHNLEQLVREGKFREDLYFRLNVFPIRLLALRQRREDIPDLLRYFIQVHAGDKRRIEINQRALNRLMQYDWPGNIRELENFVERTVLLKGDDQVITEEDVDSLNPVAPEPSVRNLQTLDDAERAMIGQALEKTQGNVSRAAKLLKISRDTFYRKIRKYSIKLRKYSLLR